MNKNFSRVWGFLLQSPVVKLGWMREKIFIVHCFCYAIVKVNFILTLSFIQSEQHAEWGVNEISKLSEIKNAVYVDQRLGAAHPKCWW